MTSQELLSELQGIFADAEAGTDLANIEHRLSIAATKVDALIESGNAPEGFTRFLTTTLDTIRSAIGNDPDKAQFYIKAMSELVRGNDDAAEDAITDYQVREFIKGNNLSQ